MKSIRESSYGQVSIFGVDSREERAGRKVITFLRHPIARLRDGLSSSAAVAFPLGLRPLAPPRECRLSLWSNAICAMPLCEAAKPPSTVSISRPCRVVLSAHASLSERKPAFAPHSHFISSPFAAVVTERPQAALHTLDHKRVLVSSFLHRPNLR
jgi:hypothetical protein